MQPALAASICILRGGGNKVRGREGGQAGRGRPETRERRRCPRGVKGSTNITVTGLYPPASFLYTV